MAESYKGGWRFIAKGMNYFFDFILIFMNLAHTLFAFVSIIPLIVISKCQSLFLNILFTHTEVRQFLYDIEWIWIDHLISELSQKENPHDSAEKSWKEQLEDLYVPAKSMPVLFSSIINSYFEFDFKKVAKKTYQIFTLPLQNDQSNFATILKNRLLLPIVMVGVGLMEFVKFGIFIANGAVASIFLFTALLGYGIAALPTMITRAFSSKNTTNNPNSEPSVESVETTQLMPEEKPQTEPTHNERNSVVDHRHFNRPMQAHPTSNLVADTQPPHFNFNAN